MQRNSRQRQLGFIKMFYVNRALEWINIRKLFHDILIFFNFSQLCLFLEDITFCYSYDNTLSTVFYKPADVFKKFSFIHLFDDCISCACMTTTRLRKFCDPLTESEKSSFCKAAIHVRTMNMGIIQHKDLRYALTQGLNHIPLKPTAIG
jgi:hypothetical protein